MVNTWNPKHPFINGCFNWMIPNLYIGNGCFTKHPCLTGCLGFQVQIFHFIRGLYGKVFVFFPCTVVPQSRDCKWGDYGVPSNNQKNVLGLARFCCFLDLLFVVVFSFNFQPRLFSHHFQLEKGGTSPRLFWGSFKDTSKLRLQ